MTASNRYLGGLRTELTHLRSGQVIITDAPIDNEGRGEAFSPTDLLAASLVSCKLTTMAIFAQKHSLPEIIGTGTINKVMADSPRRVTRLEVTLTIDKGTYNEENIARLEAAARACPVARSLHPDLVIEAQFIWI